MEMVEKLTDKQLIAKIIKLANQLDKTDSKSEEKELREKFKGLETWRFDGRLVRSKKNPEKIWRIFHSYSGTYRLYGNKTHDYTWSNNTSSTTLDNVEFIGDEYADVDAEKILEYEEKISKLKGKIREIQGECFHLVDTEAFEDTTEINRGAFSGSGEPVYYRETWCEICNIRIIS